MSNLGRLFSKRQTNDQESGDVFTYDRFPPDFRTKIIHLLNDALGNPTNASSGGSAYLTYQDIYEYLRREYGVFSLVGNEVQNAPSQVLQFFYDCDEYKKVIDVIELTFRVIYNKIQQPEKRQAQATSDGAPIFPGLSVAALSNHSIKIQPKAAIERLNELFLEHHIGYQFESGEIIRIDSQVIHSEVVTPVLSLLADQKYKGANEEFLKAHEHYRHGRNKECLVECLKAFESTMKIICHNRGWTLDKKDNPIAKNLIKLCLQKKLIPDYLQSQFSSLRCNLESGIPTVRNKLAGHGQGEQVISVPDYFASYLLHLTATTMLFLINADRNLP